MIFLISLLGACQLLNAGNTLNFISKQRSCRIAFEALRIQNVNLTSLNQNEGRKINDLLYRFTKSHLPSEISKLKQSQAHLQELTVSEHSSLEQKALVEGRYQGLFQWDSQNSSHGNSNSIHSKEKYHLLLRGKKDILQYLNHVDLLNKNSSSADFITFLKLQRAAVAFEKIRKRNHSFATKGIGISLESIPQFRMEEVVYIELRRDIQVLRKRISEHLSQPKHQRDHPVNLEAYQKTLNIITTQIKYWQKHLRKDLIPEIEEYIISRKEYPSKNDQQVAGETSFYTDNLLKAFQFKDQKEVWSKAVQNHKNALHLLKIKQEFYRYLFSTHLYNSNIKNTDSKLLDQIFTLGSGGISLTSLLDLGMHIYQYGTYDLNSLGMSVGSLSLAVLFQAYKPFNSIHLKNLKKENRSNASPLIFNSIREGLDNDSFKEGDWVYTGINFPLYQHTSREMKYNTSFANKQLDLSYEDAFRSLPLSTYIRSGAKKPIELNDSYGMLDIFFTYDPAYGEPMLAISIRTSLESPQLPKSIRSAPKEPWLDLLKLPEILFPEPAKKND